MTNTTNYMTPTQAQLLGGQMTPLTVQNAAPVPQSNPMGAIPQMTPQMMQQLSGMGTQPQFPNNYTDSSGVSGMNLNQAGIAPGNGGGGLMGLNTYDFMGGGGNPLGLSSGSQFSPQDLQALQGAFNG